MKLFSLRAVMLVFAISLAIKVVITPTIPQASAQETQTAQTATPEPSTNQAPTSTRSPSKPKSKFLLWLQIGFIALIFALSATALYWRKGLYQKYTRTQRQANHNQPTTTAKPLVQRRKPTR